MYIYKPESLLRELHTPIHIILYSSEKDIAADSQMTVLMYIYILRCRTLYRELHVYDEYKVENRCVPCHKVYGCAGAVESDSHV